MRYGISPWRLQKKAKDVYKRQQQGQCGERQNRERGIGKTFEDRDKYCAQRVCRLVIPFMGACNEMQEKGEAEKVGAEENLRSCAAFLGGIMIG